MTQLIDADSGSGGVDAGNRGSVDKGEVAGSAYLLHRLRPAGSDVYTGATKATQGGSSDAGGAGPLAVIDRTKRFAVRGVLPRVLRVARRVAPTTNTVLVTGFPSTEGNAVETARALTRRFTGDVVWVDAPTRSYLSAIGFSDGQLQRIRSVAKADPRTLWRFATASAVFFTHGLYGDPGVDPRKLTVNLWHGNGMKRNASLFPDRRIKSLPSDFLVACSQLWGEEMARTSRLGPGQLIVSGYPRSDQLSAEPSSNSLRTLGIDASATYVVWMPSYRTAKSSGTMREFSDTTGGQHDRELAARFQVGVDALHALGVTVVVKPHPLDSVVRTVRGAVVVDEAALEDAGVSLYSLLGSSSGLISDSSSVWVDYLVADKPVGFFFPDHAEYASGRGFFPADVLEWLPGPMLASGDDFEAFGRSCLEGGHAWRARRAAFRDRVGLQQTHSAADDLLDVLSGRKGAFAASLRSRDSSDDGAVDTTDPVVH